jgi:neutral ceramidase
MAFRAGFASLPVTPPVPGPMGGYLAREGPSEGVHDDLWARAVVLESAGVKAGLVLADLVAAPRTLVDEVRREAAPRLGVSPENVVVAATHTHSGPAVPPFPPAADPHYVSWVADTMADALSKADGDLSPARAGWAEAAAEGMAANRRDPELPVDPSVRSIALWGEDGSLRGLLLNYACHPTVLGPSNRRISADFPGAATEALRASLGDGVWAAYAQGAAGDVSCRFTRRGQTFEEVSRLGTIVGEAGLEGVDRAKSLADEPLLVASRSVSLPARSFPPREETRARLEDARRRAEEVARSGAEPASLRLAESLVEGYTAELLIGERREVLETEAEVTAIRLGDAALVALPGEPFTSVGRAIRERSPMQHTMVLGYSGGYIGYVPDRQAYASGGYEALVSWLEPTAADLLVDAAAGLLAELARGRA